MRYYDVAVIDTPTVFTYQSDKNFTTGDVVKIPLKNKILNGYVIKETSKPHFECKDIIEKVYEFD